ncbi:MAG TPA: cytochrome c3 family protein, partial [Pyrinomonadaceae bacterium]|nr:cytochrome c3 family protein [Pyrinomonadaceae bacterium]
MIPITLVVLATLLVISFRVNSIEAASLRTYVDQRAQRRQNVRSKPSPDYSRFSHQTHVTSGQLACGTCHNFPTENWKTVRKGDAAFPDVAEFPRHETCLNCHRTQFFIRQRPAPAICSNCHVNVTPRDSTRFLFPSLGDLEGTSRSNLTPEFGVNFPHGKHIDVVGKRLPEWQRVTPFAFLLIKMQDKPAATQSAEPKSCPVCHETYQPQGSSDDEYVTKPPKDLGDNFWLKKGTFKTIPNSHTVCFSCHNTDAGIPPLPNECQVCHKLKSEGSSSQPDFDANLLAVFGVRNKVIVDASRKRDSSGTFRHEGGEHPNISCLNCHDVQTMNTTELKTLR